MNDEDDFFPEDRYGVNPDKIDIKELCAAWIAARGQYSRAWVQLDGLIRLAPIKAFDAILAIEKSLLAEPPPAPDLRGLLAAGPLEDLLAEHGEALFDLVAARAQREPEFRKLLRGVWKNAMSEALYARVKALQDPDFRFD